MQKTTLEDMLIHFVEAKSAAGLSTKTLFDYQHQIGLFLRQLPEREGIPDLASAIEKHLNHQRRKGLAAASVSASYRALSTWLNWCERRRLIDVSPMRYVDRPRVPKKVAKYVTFAEFRAFFESIDGNSWIDHRDRLIVLLLYFSGMRVGELCELEDADIEPGDLRILIRQGKGMKSRFVPMHEDAASLLHSYTAIRPTSAYSKLLVSNDGFGGVCGVLTPEGVRQMILRRCKRTGIKYLHPHSWRHGFAMWTLNAGLNLSGVSALMGHSSVTVTESVYAHWNYKNLAREYRQALAKIEG